MSRSVGEQSISDCKDALETFLRSGADDQIISFNVHNGNVKASVVPVAQSTTPRKVRARFRSSEKGDLPDPRR